MTEKSKTRISHGRSCPACLGIGSSLVLEWTRDDSGVSMYKKVTVRRDCEICHGAGKVMAEQIEHVQFCQIRTMRHPVPEPHGDSGLATAYFLCLAVFAYLGFELSRDPGEMSLWFAGMIALTASAGLWIMFKKSRRSQRLFRRYAVFLLVVTIFGGIAIEWLGS